MITGRCWFRVPKSIKFIYKGKLNKWVGGKDLILHTIGDIGVDGALQKAMEFCGETIEGLEIDDRLSMCNMVIEAGGKKLPPVPVKLTVRDWTIPDAAWGDDAAVAATLEAAVSKAGLAGIVKVKASAPIPPEVAIRGAPVSGSRSSRK